MLEIKGMCMKDLKDLKEGDIARIIGLNCYAGTIVYVFSGTLEGKPLSAVSLNTKRTFWSDITANTLSVELLEPGTSLLVTGNA